MMNIRYLLLATLTMIMPACMIIDDGHSTCHDDLCVEVLGDIQFYWGFELDNGTVTDSCDHAQVARIDMYVYNVWGELEYDIDRPCQDQGSIITNFYPGSYDLQLVAVCRNGVISHEGYWEMEVYEGTNDFGLLTLFYLGAC